MISQIDTVLYGSKYSLYSSSTLLSNYWQGEVGVLSPQNDEELKWFALYRNIKDTETKLLGCTGPSFHFYSGVSSLSWITGNKTFAAGADDANIYVLSLSDSGGVLGIEEQSVLEDHEDVITCLDSKEKKLVSSGFDGDVKLWNLLNPDAPEISIPTFNGIVWDVKFMDLNVAGVASQGGDIHLHDFRERNKGKPRLRSNHSPGIASVSISFNPAVLRALACGRENGTVSCYDVRKMGQLPIFEHYKLHLGAVHALGFNKSGSTLASGGDDAQVFLVPSSGASPERLEVGHVDYVRTLAWQQSSSLNGLLSGSWDGTVKLTKIGVQFFPFR